MYTLKKQAYVSLAIEFPTEQLDENTNLGHLNVIRRDTENQVQKMLTEALIQYNLGISDSIHIKVELDW